MTSFQIFYLAGIALRLIDKGARPAPAVARVCGHNLEAIARVSHIVGLCVRG